MTNGIRGRQVEVQVLAAAQVAQGEATLPVDQRDAECAVDGHSFLERSLDVHLPHPFAS